MKKSKTTGRPREFDADEALDKALEVFWERGYEGASLTDLTSAMGITRPSLYAAYGNKEELFRKALDRYAERAAETLATLEGSRAREALEAFLVRSVTGMCAEKGGRGCLLVQGALSCSEENDVVRQELASRRCRMEKTILRRLERAAEEGELPAGVDVGDLARFYSTVSQGLSVQAAGGARRGEMLKVIATAMRAWPVG